MTITARVPQPETKVVPLDVERIRQDFPALHQEVHGKRLVYLDNAATTQRPSAVLEALHHYYAVDNANIHRGIHALSERATEAFEAARGTVQHFLHAASPREIIFVRGATEGINLVAQSFARSRLKSGDEVVVTELEHHSNIVPWQMVCEATGAKLQVVPVTEVGELDLEKYEALLTEKVKLVAVAHVSNALGTINPIARMIRMAHRWDIPVLVDGAQSVPHLAVDVQALDVDFYVFSGHKVYGPTGIGVVFGKEKWLEEMPPYQGGGDMIRTVSFEKTTYNEIPFKFEAGTPHIAGAIGLAAALKYVQQVGLEKIAAYEAGLLGEATNLLLELEGMRMVGTAREKAGVLSFVMNLIHPHDIGTVLDREGVAIRAGHHCTMPLMKRLGIPATARASFSFYNTHTEVHHLASALKQVQEIFR